MATTTTTAAETTAAGTRLSLLRKELELSQVQGFVCYSSDPHNSEYVSAYHSRRAFISGFDGSAGTVIVTGTQALLWTDGRYHEQATQQLGEEWTLMKQGAKGVPSVTEWLTTSGLETVGVDPFVTAQSDYDRLVATKVSIVCLSSNPIDVVWADERPARPDGPVQVLDATQFCGEDVPTKIRHLRHDMTDGKIDALVLTALDEVAWTFNMRGSDIEFNPVFLSFALIPQNVAIPPTLYLNPAAATNSTVHAHLTAHGVRIVPYGQVAEDMKEQLIAFDAKRVSVDPYYCNVAISQLLTSCCAEVVMQQSPVAIRKAVKNETELKGMRNCHVRDAAAMCAFLHWLEEELQVRKNTSLDEVSVATKLAAFRAQQPLFQGLSFETISAAGPNGAVIHYAPEKKTARPVTVNEMFLCDSGGQYLDGTTDITRTCHFGTPTAYEKECFTRVLQGHIALADACFPAGTTGPKLDVLARAALWKVGLNYMHGTGHGVGMFLNVHEGPHGISSTMADSRVSRTPLQAGMTVTNEPGFYESGKFGIRIESVMIVEEAKGLPYSFGTQPWLCFDTIALAPLQRNLIQLHLLSPQEIAWVDNFHAKCLARVSPLLVDQPAVLDWLKKETQPLYT